MASEALVLALAILFAACKLKGPFVPLVNSPASEGH